MYGKSNNMHIWQFYASGIWFSRFLCVSRQSLFISKPHFLPCAHHKSLQQYGPGLFSLASLCQHHATTDYLLIRAREISNSCVRHRALWQENRAFFTSLTPPIIPSYPHSISLRVWVRTYFLNPRVNAARRDNPYHFAAYYLETHRVNGGIYQFQCRAIKRLFNKHYESEPVLKFQIISGEHRDLTFITRRFRRH